MAKRDHRQRQAQLAAILKTARRKAGLTQTKLARKLGRPQSFVAKYEGSERKIDVVDLLAICEAIEISWKSVLEDYEENLS